MRRAELHGLEHRRLPRHASTTPPRPRSSHRRRLFVTSALALRLPPTSPADPRPDDARVRGDGVCVGVVARNGAHVL